MHVCLINPPHPYLKQPTAQAPLGLLYIVAALRQAGVDVELFDLSDKYYEDEFAIPEADLYGLTGTILDRVPCTTVAKAIKEKYKKAKVIIGGPISLTPELLDTTFFDSVVQGEGEEIIFDILKDHPKLLPIYKAKRIVDLDSIPFPARDMVDDLGGNVFAFNVNYRPGGSTVIITSRGCPHLCAFCASPGIWGKRVYFRSVKNVLEEIKEIKDTFGISQLRFSDDTLTLKVNRLKELCEGMKKYDLIWRASIRVKPNSVDMFKEMYLAGCREVSFGIESGDDDVLRFLKKGVTVQDNYDGILNARKAGMVVRILFMIGTPGETESTVDKNIDFLKKVDGYYATIALTNYLPLPGSGIVNDPGAFDCEIIDKNIDNYNFYMWGPEGLNKWCNTIKLNNMSLEKLSENKKRMREYVINCGKSNLG